MFRIFTTLSIPNRKSSRADILRECSPPTMCHMSCVMCPNSCVMCHVSLIRFQVGGDKIIELVGEGLLSTGPTLSSSWRVTTLPQFIGVFSYLQPVVFCFTAWLNEGWKTIPEQQKVGLPKNWRELETSGASNKDWRVACNYQVWLSVDNRNSSKFSAFETIEQAQMGSLKKEACCAGCRRRPIAMRLHR